MFANSFVSRSSKFRGKPRIRSCAQGRSCATVTEQLQRKSRSPLLGMGNNFRSDLLLDASYVNDDDHFLVSVFFCSRSASSVYVTTGLSVSSSKRDVLKKSFDHPKQTHFSVSSQNRQLIAIRSFPRSNILNEYPTAFLLNLIVEIIVYINN